MDDSEMKRLMSPVKEVAKMSDTEATHGIESISPQETETRSDGKLDNMIDALT